MRTWFVALGAFAFAAAIGMEIYRRTEIARLNSKHSSFKEEAGWIAAAIEKQLQSPSDCTQLLGGTTFAPLAETPVALEYSYDPSIPGPVKAGNAITTGFVIERAALRVESALGDTATGADLRTQSALFPGEKLTRYPVRLHLGLRKSDGSLSTRQFKDIGSSEPFYLWTNAAGTVITCFGRNSAGAFCNAMGGFFSVTHGCRPSVHSQAFVNGSWSARGACRYGGIVATPGSCVSRFGSAFQPIELQAGLPAGGIDTQYLCMSCE